MKKNRIAWEKLCQSLIIFHQAHSFWAIGLQQLMLSEKQILCITPPQEIYVGGKLAT